MSILASVAILLAVVGFLTYVVIIYNELVRLRNDNNRAWANLDVLLKQRHDEIPNLVSTVKGYMMLVEEGKIGLEDPLTKYFPEAPAAWKNVTVRQLLSHTGGFTDYPKNFDFRRDRTENQILKAIEAVPLAYPPGTKWAYSNLGYATLGILIHRASGKFYGDFLQERVFGPLGMVRRHHVREHP